MTRPDVTLGCVKSNTMTLEPVDMSSTLSLPAAWPEGTPVTGMVDLTEKFSAEINRTNASGACSTTATTCPAVVSCSSASLHAARDVKQRIANRLMAGKLSRQRSAVSYQPSAFRY